MSRRFVPESTTLPEDIKDILIEFGMYVRSPAVDVCVLVLCLWLSRTVRTTSL